MSSSNIARCLEGVRCLVVMFEGVRCLVVMLLGI